MKGKVNYIYYDGEDIILIINISNKGSWPIHTKNVITGKSDGYGRDAIGDRLKEIGHKDDYPEYFL